MASPPRLAFAAMMTYAAISASPSPILLLLMPIFDYYLLYCNIFTLNIDAAELIVTLSFQAAELHDLLIFIYIITFIIPASHASQPRMPRRFQEILLTDMIFLAASQQMPPAARIAGYADTALVPIGLACFRRRR